MIIDINYLKENFLLKEFFLIAVSYNSSLQTYIEEQSSFYVTQSPHFFSISSKNIFSQTGIVHEDQKNITIFRGYDLEVKVHSHSEQLASLNQAELTNGVFAFIQFNKIDCVTTVKTDMLGISPIYYRNLNGTILISSHPNLLKTDFDKPDPISELSLLKNGFIFGDRTCYAEINRIPPATVMTIKGGIVKSTKWHDYSSFPAGVERISERAFEEVEEAFSASMEKCLLLSNQKILLPLSSGYDSRRIFAYLVEKNIKFETITSQAYKKIGNRFYDIDGNYAPLIAKKFNVNNKLIKATTGSSLYLDFEKRDNLLGNETLMHSWSIPLINALDTESPSIIFDGLAGDTLGNTGFEFPGFHVEPEKNLEILFNETKKSFLSKKLINSSTLESEFCEAYWQSLNTLPNTPNQCELAFLLFRTRRSISPWITFTQNKNHLVLFPYVDKNHVYKTLKYKPADKYKHFFQKRCLKDFYPNYYNFQGSRDMPSVLKPIDSDQTKKIMRAENEYYMRENIIKLISNKLSINNRRILNLSNCFPFLSGNRSWLFKALAQLASASENRPIILNKIN